MKRNKYGAVKCEFNGWKCDSKLERDLGIILNNHHEGELKHHFIIAIFDEMGEDQIDYEFDYVCFNEDGFPQAVYEAKGKVLQAYRIQRKLIRHWCRVQGVEYYEYTAKKGLVRIK